LDREVGRPSVCAHHTHEKTLKDLVAAGVEIVEIPRALREGRSGTAGASYSVKLAYAKDPDGNWVEFYEHSDPIPPSIPEGY